MRNIIVASLSISIIACQEQTPQQIDDATQIETAQIDQQIGSPIEIADLNHNTKHHFDKMDQPFHTYLIDKLEDLESPEEITLENLQPQQVPVDANCIYGGELEGTIELTLDTDPTWISIPLMKMISKSKILIAWFSPWPMPKILLRATSSLMAC